ncbi:480_t:CDS:1 [Funneliformis caledonium]|uniref:480_t:CDS:1 n=1 Tax=Funneliformis caledonium TaxID=1117310 RepID=A0A9N9H9D5_9GLOM|nr:480_t:CDS:1 [Funneliformis caledonium]
MATECLYMLKIIRKLQDPVPQYVLGCLPAIATIGVAPWVDFMEKLIWLIRCLGCPFTGLFYTCCVKSDETSLCVYWLSSDRFIRSDNDNLITEIPNRPFGVHAMNIEQSVLMKACVAKASVLERLSSLASLYYILIGIVSEISRVVRPTICDEDWPSIPLALSWTLPAIYRRTIRNNLVAFDPNNILGNYQITVNKLAEHNKNDHYARVTFAALVSIVVPWITVLLAYFTPPIGFYCRSKYLSVLCSIWSFNSILALLSHLKGEKSVNGNGLFHAIFFICGVKIACLLFVLGLLSNQNTWWVGLFGNACDISSACKVAY